MLTGFKIGAGLLIASSQLGKVLGVALESDGFSDNVRSAVEQLDAVNGPTIALALGSIALILVLRRAAPRVPATLLAFVAGIIAVRAFDLASHDVVLVGSIESGLPALSLPRYGWGTCSGTPCRRDSANGFSRVH